MPEPVSMAESSSVRPSNRKTREQQHHNTICSDIKIKQQSKCRSEHQLEKRDMSIMLKHLQTVFDHKKTARVGLDLDQGTRRIQDICDEAMANGRKVRRTAPASDKFKKLQSAVGQVIRRIA